MTYNPQNAKEVEGSSLPKDSILDGIVVGITDGKVSDFVGEEHKDKWKGDMKQPCINVSIEVKHNNEIVKLEQVFTYKEENSQTVYPKGSNMSKYKDKYGQLPAVQQQVKVATDGKGFGKIKLE